MLTESQYSSRWERKKYIFNRKMGKIAQAGSPLNIAQQIELYSGDPPQPHHFVRFRKGSGQKHQKVISIFG